MRWSCGLGGLQAQVVVKLIPHLVNKSCQNKALVSAPCHCRCPGWEGADGSLTLVSRTSVGTNPFAPLRHRKPFQPNPTSGRGTVWTLEFEGLGKAPNCAQNSSRVGKPQGEGIEATGTSLSTQRAGSAGTEWMEGLARPQHCLGCASMRPAPRTPRTPRPRNHRHVSSWFWGLEVQDQGEGRCGVR